MATNTEIKFINAIGEVFNIILPNYILQDYEGFESAPVSHNMTKAPYQNGKTLIDTNFEERKSLSIEFEIQAATRNLLQARRRIVTKHFNPKLGLGNLVYTDDDGNVFYIDCVAEDIMMPGGDARGRTFQKVVIPLVAPNPFWYNPVQENYELVSFSGGLSFPFSFPINFGTVQDTRIIINNGNVETPVLIVFKGEIVDPEIENETTGEIISVVRTVNDGDQLWINTEYGNKYVRLYSGGAFTNSFEYVDPDSKFFTLVPGENIITYRATSEGANASCSLSFYHRYSGV